MKGIVICAVLTSVYLAACFWDFNKNYFDSISLCLLTNKNPYNCVLNDCTVALLPVSIKILCNENTKYRVKYRHK